MAGFDGSTRFHAHGHSPVGQEAKVQSNAEETLEGATESVHCQEASNCTNNGHGDEMVYELGAEIGLIVMSKPLVDNVIAKEDGSTHRHMSWCYVFEHSEQKEKEMGYYNGDRDDRSCCRLTSMHGQTMLSRRWQRRVFELQNH